MVNVVLKLCIYLLELWENHLKNNLDLPDVCTVVMPLNLGCMLAIRQMKSLCLYIAGSVVRSEAPSSRWGRLGLGDRLVCLCPLCVYCWWFPKFTISRGGQMICQPLLWLGSNTELRYLWAEQLETVDRWRSFWILSAFIRCWESCTDFKMNFHFCSVRCSRATAAVRLRFNCVTMTPLTCPHPCSHRQLSVYRVAVLALDGLSFFISFLLFVPLLHLPATPFVFGLSPPQFMSFLTLVVDIRLWLLR